MFGIIAYSGLTLTNEDNNRSGGNNVSAQNIQNNILDNLNENGNNTNNASNNQNESLHGQSQERRQDNLQFKFEERERLRLSGNASNLPKECRQDGSVLRCNFANGTREMTIMAGKSGNTIFQVKGDNVTTKIQLYQREGAVYGQFGNNTKELKYMPEQIREKIQTHVKAKIENKSFNFELNENGQYEVQLKNNQDYLD